MWLVFNVIRLGFEPKTHSLEGCCSIQLSYRTIGILPFWDCKYSKISYISHRPGKIPLLYGKLLLQSFNLSLLLSRIGSPNLKVELNLRLCARRS